jgi:hypothetical protein
VFGVAIGFGSQTLVRDILSERHPQATSRGCHARRRFHRGTAIGMIGQRAQSRPSIKAFKRRLRGSPLAVD